MGPTKIRSLARKRKYRAKTYHWPLLAGPGHSAAGRGALSWRTKLVPDVTFGLRFPYKPV